MKMPTRQIIIGDRHRKDMGDLDALASSIADIGLLQPIGVAPDNRLIFGERRLRAFRDILGETEIDVRIIDMPHIVVGESAENEVRKDFTASERVAIARAIEEEMGDRRGINQHTPKEERQDFATPENRTADFAAQKAGFGNRETYRQAKNVVDNAAPELVAAMDEGKVSILAAHRATKLPVEDQREVAKTGKTFADLERDIHRRHREGVADKHPQLKIQTITDAVMDIAYCGMTAAEFRQLAPKPTLLRLQQVALPAFAFLKDMVEVASDQTRAG